MPTHPDASSRNAAKNAAIANPTRYSSGVVPSVGATWNEAGTGRNPEDGPARREKILRAVELRGLSGGQIGWLGSLQDSVDEVGSTMATCRNARAASAHRGRPVHDDTDARDLTAGCA